MLVLSRARGDVAAKFTLVLSLLSSIPACSVFLDFDGDQCNVDVDCRRFSAIAQCDTATHVCRERPTDSGVDRSVTTSQSVDSGASGSGEIDRGTSEEFPADSSATGSAEASRLEASTIDAPQCEDLAGLHEAGCWSCAKATREQYLNACTDALCIPFDNAARIGRWLLDGSLPSLPALESGAVSPADAGGCVSEGDCRADVAPATVGKDDAAVSNPLDHDETKVVEAGDGRDSAQAADGAAASDAGSDSSYPPCAALANVVYVTGSSAAKPMLAAMALVLGSSTSVEPVNIVYRSQGSCVGVDAIMNNTRMTGTGSYAASYWDGTESDPARQEKKCNIASGGEYADLGVSDVFATSCYALPQGLPPTVLDSFGPVQTMTFAVPVTSSQTAISAEAAYLVFGLGSEAGVAPWTHDTTILQRNPSSGTQSMIAATIGLPASEWRGRSVASSGDMAALLQAASGPSQAEATIGILATDYIDPARNTIRALAFQDYRQKCSFLPDSTPASRDKRNVRDGHYPIWGPLHLFTRLNADARPADVRATTIVNYFSGTTPLPNGTQLLTLYADKSLVPICAMQVARGTDGGPMKAYHPVQPCGCFFEELVGVVPNCTKCKVGADCPTDAPNCSYGYCEP